uniref:Uncharacterized protein n=1 Tax=Picea glauca TaxID=3330 RepID=A0A117NJD1_PICGL|nr:hypothetical protein ABT39_MTgene1122 [Picea glauca]QHR87758.1 hypothetical protein Q903MT_gene1770 [Picea sitchensis]
MHFCGLVIVIKTNLAQLLHDRLGLLVLGHKVGGATFPDPLNTGSPFFISHPASNQIQ